MRRLELLEQQLGEERLKRRETERRVLELLEQSKGGGGVESFRRIPLILRLDFKRYNNSQYGSSDRICIAPDRA